MVTQPPPPPTVLYSGLVPTPRVPPVGVTLNGSGAHVGSATQYKLKFPAVAQTSYYTPSRPVVPLAAERWRSCSARELPVDLQAHLLPTQQTHELCSWSHRVGTAPKGVKGEIFYNGCIITFIC